MATNCGTHGGMLAVVFSFCPDNSIFGGGRKIEAVADNCLILT
jgi:hypothetical protein